MEALVVAIVIAAIAVAIPKNIMIGRYSTNNGSRLGMAPSPHTKTVKCVNIGPGLTINGPRQ